MVLSPLRLPSMSIAASPETSALTSGLRKKAMCYQPSRYYIYHFYATHKLYAMW